MMMKGAKRPLKRRIWQEIKVFTANPHNCHSTQLPPEVVSREYIFDEWDSGETNSQCIAFGDSRSKSS